MQRLRRRALPGDGPRLFALFYLTGREATARVFTFTRTGFGSCPFGPRREDWGRQRLAPITSHAAAQADRPLSSPERLTRHFFPSARAGGTALPGGARGRRRSPGHAHSPS